MTAKEVIDALSNVSPDTEVRVATEAGVYGIAEVRTLGYSQGVANIVTEE